MAGDGIHEPRELLSHATQERHRAIRSLMEELEAVDWYDQRVDATTDDDLRAVLAHNRDEEKEHAVMTLEWIRRHDPVFDEMLRRFLFVEGPIGGDDHDHPHADDGRPAGPPSDGSLGLGGLEG